jgi:hypothetical protein
MKDHLSLSFTFEIPVPPDELLREAGFHASMAQLHPVIEQFTVDAPKKLDPQSKKILFYPRKETPLWTVYKYSFEKEIKDEEPDKIEIDLTSMFTKNDDK